MTEIALPRTELAPNRRPRLGYAMTLIAATLFAVNGTVSKVILDTGISSLRLSELRATCGAAGLALGLILLAPGRLRLSLREVLLRRLLVRARAMALLRRHPSPADRDRPPRRADRAGGIVLAETSR